MTLTGISLRDSYCDKISSITSFCKETIKYLSAKTQSLANKPNAPSMEWMWSKEAPASVGRTILESYIQQTICLIILGSSSGSFKVVLSTLIHSILNAVAKNGLLWHRTAWWMTILASSLPTSRVTTSSRRLEQELAFSELPRHRCACILHHFQA